jgi:hypothetical protein
MSIPDQYKVVSIPKEQTYLLTKSVIYLSMRLGNVVLNTDMCIY